MTDPLSAAFYDYDYPRDLYLNAEDVLKARPGISENDLAVIKNIRFGMFRHVHAKAEDFSAAVKALKSFDRTGNIGSALGHVEDTFHDLQAVTKNLISDIEAAETQYQGNSVLPAPGQPTKPAAAPEPTPQASAAAATPQTGPKPGPLMYLTDEAYARMSAERAHR